MLCSRGDDDVIVASCLGDPVCLSFKYQWLLNGYILFLLLRITYIIAHMTLENIKSANTAPLIMIITHVHGILFSVKKDVI